MQRLSIALNFIVVTAALPAVTAERPNVLVILSDDHSVPHLGCYESDYPPHPTDAHNQLPRHNAEK